MEINTNKDKKLSEFIKELQEFQEKYGDNYIYLRILSTLYTPYPIIFSEEFNDGFEQKYFLIGGDIVENPIVRD